ncbi:MAG: shikimate kinase AroK [Gammaproteobacteria bacterium]|nr:shikimate kinase AroK [Gammaproteobacteria bacterium]
MNGKSSIFLIGPMGAGKSTVGRQVAKALGRTFYDSDKEIERRTGASISLIFEVEGEEGFRAREADVIDELTGLPDIVLATGGGAVLNETNRRLLAERGLVVYLRAPLEKLYARTRLDKSRPLLQGDNPRARLTRIVREREPLYRETADLIIETDNHTVRQIVNLLRNQTST